MSPEMTFALYVQQAQKRLDRTENRRRRFETEPTTTPTSSKYDEERHNWKNDEK